MAATSAGSASETAWLEPEPVFVHTKLLMIMPLPDPLVVPACDLDRADARLATPGFTGHVRVRSSTCVGAFAPSGVNYELRNGKLVVPPAAGQGTVFSYSR